MSPVHTAAANVTAPISSSHRVAANRLPPVRVGGRSPSCSIASCRLQKMSVVSCQPSMRKTDHAGGQQSRAVRAIHPWSEGGLAHGRRRLPIVARSNGSSVSLPAPNRDDGGHERHFRAVNGGQDLDRSPLQISPSPGAEPARVRGSDRSRRHSRSEGAGALKLSASDAFLKL